MDFSEKFNSIHTFLKPYSYLWSEEVLDRFPQCLEDSNPYLDSLLNLEVMDLLRIENLEEIGNPLIDALLIQIKTLIDIPKIDFFQKEGFDSRKNFTRMSVKKIHEVTQISKYLHSEKLNHIIDIGGGVGHLSQHLIQYNQATATSIDMDPILQEQGKARINRLYSDINDKLEFKLVKVEKNNLNKTFNSDIQKKSKLIGLHACGELSNHLIDLYLESDIDSFLSVGCCYHKLENEINISKTAKEKPLKLTIQSKTLATRTYKKLTLQEYQKRVTVKKKRYALQLLLYKKFGIKDFVGVGNAKIQEYEKPFSDYATKRLKSINFEHKLSAKELNDFYRSPETTNAINFMVVLGTFRSLFARPIELYIILDRALYIQEKGFNVSMTEIFDNKKSPRNIALTSTR